MRQIKSDTCASDREASGPLFRLNSGYFTVLTPQEVGCGYDYLRRAGLSGGGTVVTKCAIIKQSTLITAPRGTGGGTED